MVLISFLALHTFGNGSEIYFDHVGRRKFELDQFKVL